MISHSCCCYIFAYHLCRCGAWGLYIDNGYACYVNRNDMLVLSFYLEYNDPHKRSGWYIHGYQSFLLPQFADFMEDIVWVFWRGKHAKRNWSKLEMFNTWYNSFCHHWSIYTVTSHINAIYIYIYIARRTFIYELMSAIKVYAIIFIITLWIGDACGLRWKGHHRFECWWNAHVFHVFPIRKRRWKMSAKTAYCYVEDCSHSNFLF